MQREQISIPKLIAYVLFSVIIFALQTGTFGADMKVELVNDGPVTIWIDSQNKE